MTYATLREALYDFFFTHNAPLVSDGGYYSSEDVFTALPYEKGRRYFDAVALLFQVASIVHLFVRLQVLHIQRQMMELCSIRIGSNLN